MKLFRVLIAASAALALTMSLAAATPSAATPAAPIGVTGIALSASVGLAWQAVPGVDGYTVYRGTSATAITTRLTAATGITGTSYTDTTAVNGTTYYYVVRSISGGVESANSLTVQSKPVSRACSTGNAVVLENCYPGNTGWKVVDPEAISGGGIEGFATSQSINKGDSVNLKVNADDGATFRIEIYRTGYYGGLGSRLFSVIRDVPAVRQPGCQTSDTTGLLDCSNWSTSATITTTSAWPSGVYLLRLVRTDTNTDFHVLLVVRDDSRLVLDLRGVQQLRRQVSVRLQLDRGEHRRRHPACGQGLLRPSVRAVSERPARLVPGGRVRQRLLARGVGLRRPVHLEHRPRDAAFARARSQGVPLAGTRRILVRRDAHCGHGRA
jgi:outer membrane lipoprotein SlyB